MTVLHLTDTTRLVSPEQIRSAEKRPSAARRVVRRLLRPRHTWPRVLRTGLLLWVLTIMATELTANPTLVPSVIILGSFLVPVTCVVAVWERRHAAAGNHVGAALVVRSAVVGGVCAMVLAALVERALLHRGPALYPGVGVIEETAKLVALLWCTRSMGLRTARDGIVLGASLGFGFAAVESAGYAFNALFTSTGLSFGTLVDTEVLRALLAPFGHGLWTAVLGAAWFAAFPRPLRVRLRRHRVAVAPVPRTPHRSLTVCTAMAAWAYVALLHAAFDDMPSLVARVAGVESTRGYLVGLLIVTGLGLLGLLTARNVARRQEAASPFFTARFATGAGLGRRREGALS